MRKLIPIGIGLCCLLPLLIIGIISLSNGSKVQKSADTSNRQLAGASVGSIAPDFYLTDIDGRPTSNDILKDKPAILWFTASYCVPCQIGAKEVKKLDEDLGDSKFNVVMVFIDPREKEQDLRSWKENFASTDWVIAFGNEKIINDYQIHYLDTQYLLDGNGVIRNVANSNVGYAGYKTKLQPLLQ